VLSDLDRTSPTAVTDVDRPHRRRRSPNRANGCLAELAASFAFGLVGLGALAGLNAVGVNLFVLRGLGFPMIGVLTLFILAGLAFAVSQVARSVRQVLRNGSSSAHHRPIEPSLWEAQVARLRAEHLAELRSRPNSPGNTPTGPITIVGPTPFGSVEVARQQLGPWPVKTRRKWMWVARRHGQVDWCQGSTAREAIRRATLTSAGRSAGWLDDAAAQAETELLC
jgi:hypothetical protein